MMHRVVFKSGHLQGQRVVVREGKILIGRDEDCAICLKDDKTAAFEHAVLEARDDGLHVTCIEPDQRVLVNGQTVNSSRLVNQDELQVGETRMQVQEVLNMTSDIRRRTSKMQNFTVAAIVVVIVLEVIFMTALSLIRSREIPDVLPSAQSEAEERSDR